MENEQLLEKLTAIIYEEAGTDWDKCRISGTYILPIIKAERQTTIAQGRKKGEWAVLRNLDRLLSNNTYSENGTYDADGFAKDVTELMAELRAKCSVTKREDK